MNPTQTMENLFVIALSLYLLFLAGLAFFVSGRLESEEDFLVGGRKFNLWLTTFCLFATWFGAGTLIATTDEVAAEGLHITALEPYGAGVCLILAGLFFARPLWNMKLTTYADFFREKYGNKVEFLSVILNIPIYVGWVAVQFVALAHILAVFLPAPVWLLIIGIALFSCWLTVSGGMWSVSITDSFQLIIIVIGLFYLLAKVLGMSPMGWEGLLVGIPPEKMIWIPTERWQDLAQWIGVFSISALGNMTGQDLGQRMFSARSARIAQWGCLLAGLGYIIVGSIPVFLGLTVQNTLGSFEGSVIPNLIKTYLDPVSALILTLTIISAVISTITSALLSPASMISHNFLKYRYPHRPVLKLCQWSVVGVTVVSVLTAFAGENIYSLLESSYTIGFVGFFIPVTIGLFSKKLNETACLVTIAAGIAIWSPEFFGYNGLPYPLIAVVTSIPIYFLSYRWLSQ